MNPKWYPGELPARLARVLEQELGITRPGTLAHVSELALLMTKGIGRTSLAFLRTAARDHGVVIGSHVRPGRVLRVELVRRLAQIDSKPEEDPAMTNDQRVCPRCVALRALEEVSFPTDALSSSVDTSRAAQLERLRLIGENPWRLCARHDIDACKGCAASFSSCLLLWKSQRKCCPDCDHQDTHDAPQHDGGPRGPLRRVERLLSAGVTVELWINPSLVLELEACTQLGSVVLGEHTELRIVGHDRGVLVMGSVSDVRKALEL